MNEETIIEKRPVINGQAENKRGESSWKPVTLGGVSGILLGAGLMYAGQVTAKELLSEEAEEEQSAEVTEEEAVNGQAVVTDEPLMVAHHPNDGMSFGEAFAAARAEVGPGGVFYWHGGIYGTYYADEWNAMTAEEKHEYAQRVQPEINANQVSVPTDDRPDIAVHSEMEAEALVNTEDVHVVVDQQVAEDFDMGDDVHIVGYANYDDHLVVGYDTDGDGQADVAIIDIDDNLDVSDADIILDNQGNMATIGEVMSEPDPNYLTDMDADAGMAGSVNDGLMDA